MSDEIPQLIIDIGDKEKRGLYKSFSSNVRTSLGVIVRADGMPNRFRLVRESDSDERYWDDVNTTGAQVEFAIGAADKRPTGGEWSITFGASTVSAIPYDASEDELEALLNAAAAFVSAGGVTVTRYREGVYAILFSATGERDLISVDGDLLTPECDYSATITRPGTSNRQCVQTIILKQRPYAYSGDFAGEDAGAVTVSLVQEGTATKNKLQKIIFNLKPYDGNYSILYPKPQVTKFTARPNTALAEVTQVATTSDNEESLNGKAFMLFDPDPVLVWIKVTDAASPASAPDVPDGGRLLGLEILKNKPASAVAAALKALVHTDSEFNASVVNNRVRIERVDEGPTSAAEQIDSGFILSTLTAGTTGALNNKTLKLHDENGSVALWFNSSSAGVVPEEALDCDRYITCAINDGDTAAQVATAAAAILDADAAFASTASGSIVTATDAIGGERTDAEDLTTGFPVKTSQAGKAVNANLEWNATAPQIETALQNNFEVRKTVRGFSFKSLVKGPQPAIEVTSGELRFAGGLDGVLNLNTEGLFLAFAETSAEEIEAIFEGKITYPDELPFTFYRETVRLVRSIIDASTLIPTPRASTYWVDVPASYTAAGTPGQQASDGANLWTCYGVNQWARNKTTTSGNGKAPCAYILTGVLTSEEYGEVSLILSDGQYADGAVITIEAGSGSGNVGVSFELDTNGSVTPGNVQVIVGGFTASAVSSALIVAIQSSALSPYTTENVTNNGDGTYTLVLQTQTAEDAAYVAIDGDESYGLTPVSSVEITAGAGMPTSGTFSIAEIHISAESSASSPGDLYLSVPPATDGEVYRATSAAVALAASAGRLMCIGNDTGEDITPRSLALTPLSVSQGLSFQSASGSITGGAIQVRILAFLVS